MNLLIKQIRDSSYVKRLSSTWCIIADEMSTCEQCGDVTKCLMAATLNNAANDIGLFYGGVGYGSLSKETVRGYQRYVPVCPLKQELITSIQKASGKVGKTNTN